MMRWVAVLAVLMVVLASGAAAAQVSAGLLEGLAELATVEEEGPGLSFGWRVVSPFLYDLDADVVADVMSIYPTSDYSGAAGLSAVCGYVEWIQKTGNRSVVIFYTTFDFYDSFDILADIDEISVDGQRFEPAGLPVAVEHRNRTIDYANCSCGDESFVIWAIPMPTEFLDAIKIGTAFRFLIRGWRGGTNEVPSIYTVTRGRALDEYVRLLNTMRSQ
jgi:hypothetical protein